VDNILTALALLLIALGGFFTQMALKELSKRVDHLQEGLVRYGSLLREVNSHSGDVIATGTRLNQSLEVLLRDVDELKARTYGDCPKSSK
jgi:hypothetical protein